MEVNKLLYFLYFLYSESIDQYYTGISNNPDKRLFYHNNHYKGWTKRGRPWELVFTKQFSTKAKAEKWKQWIKQQKNRSLIEKIIQGDFNWDM